MKCFYCDADGLYLCDFVLGYASGGIERGTHRVTRDSEMFTCDRPLCEQHRVNKGHTHFCSRRLGWITASATRRSRRRGDSRSCRATSSWPCRPGFSASRCSRCFSSSPVFFQGGFVMDEERKEPQAPTIRDKNGVEFKEGDI